jgi:transcriptional regulator with XRE-family HTH domain
MTSVKSQPDKAVRWLELRRARQRLGLSLTKLTALTGIATTDLSLLERGLRPPFPGWRRRIAEALGMREEDLFRSTEDPPNNAA